MDERTRAEIELKLAKAQLGLAEMLLTTTKRARWCELVIFSSVGVTIGLSLGLAPLFMR